MNVSVLGGEKSFTKCLKLNWVQQFLPYGDILKWNNFTLLTKLGLPVLAAIRSVAATDTLPEGTPNSVTLAVCGWQSPCSLPLPVPPHTGPSGQNLSLCHRDLQAPAGGQQGISASARARSAPSPCETPEQSRRAGEPCPQSPLLSSAQTHHLYLPTLLLQARRRVAKAARFSPWAAWGWGC